MGLVGWGSGVSDCRAGPEPISEVALVPVGVATVDRWRHVPGEVALAPVPQNLLPGIL
jgi:hypothetical protein